VLQSAHLDLVRNSDNRGFAAACNQGAGRGTAPYLLFLNPDVRARPDAVAKARSYLDDPSHCDIGIIGAQLLDAEGRVQRSCARTPTVAALLLRSMFLERLCPGLVPPHFMREWDHRDTRPVDQVMGAFLMVRRQLFEALQGFDERFFLYAAARKLHLEPRLIEMAGPRNYEAALDGIGDARGQPVILPAGPMFLRDREKIGQALLVHRAPSIAAFRENTEAGTLISYGFDLIGLFGDIAGYVHQIARGAKPAEMPIEQSARFHMAVNLKTATALGISLPDTFVARANEVLE
jgi:hypothetical protein